MPFRFRLAADTLPSGVLMSGGFRSALICFRLSPLCPVRRLHTFHLLRPARNYPHFRIQRSSFERQRDLNPPDQCAAQRTLLAHPSPSRLSTDFPCFGYTVSLCSADFATGRGGLLQLLGISLSSCCRYYPARVSRRISQIATFHAAFAPLPRARPLGLTFSGPPVDRKSTRLNS